MTALAQGNSSRVFRTAAVAPARRRSSPWLGLRITFSGLLCGMIVGLIGLAALHAQANLLLLLFGISGGAILLSAVAAVRMVSRVQVERIVPQVVSAGRPFTIVYLVRSRRRWMRCWSLVIGEMSANPAASRFPRAFVVVLEAGQEQRIELVGNLPRRGRVALAGIRVVSRFPFGLFSCTVDHAARAELTVYPVVGRFRHDPWKGKGYPGCSAGRARRDEAGQDEFYGVREYREGDNLRWVHWRRSARTGQLVVREMMPVRTAQLIVLVDPWPGPPPAGSSRWRHGAAPDPAVERVISAAATALCDGLERGHRVGLVCRAAVPVVLAPAGGRPHRQRLLHELALISPWPQEGLDELVSRIRWSGGWQARCAVCAPRLDETHDRVVRFLGRRSEAVMVLSPQTEGFDALLMDPCCEPVGDRRGR